jgi:hypothetical protein
MSVELLPEFAALEEVDRVIIAYDRHPPRFTFRLLYKDRWFAGHPHINCTDAAHSALQQMARVAARAHNNPEQADRA